MELPLTHFDLYRQIGIDPPRGVLLYGPPGTGKTMLAKAVAHHTTAAFIRVVGSEFVQKYLSEGPRMVRDVFRLAKENAPAIIFIDEVDSIATARFDAHTGADREVQRILMELLNQMDGFDQTVNVKVIMATNRADTLDPALLRPGRLDRKIECPHPDRRQKRLVFQVCVGKMSLSDEVDLEDTSVDPTRFPPQIFAPSVKRRVCRRCVRTVTSYYPKISRSRTRPTCASRTTTLSFIVKEPLLVTSVMMIMKI